MMNCEHPMLLSSSTDGQTLFEVLELMFSFNALTNVFDNQNQNLSGTLKRYVYYICFCVRFADDE